MKYLVTGGAGFIGTNLVKTLLEQNHEVVVVDNYVGGYKKERIQKKAKYINVDICNFKKLNKVCAGGFDGIFHLAALPRVTYSVENPLETHKVNVDGTLQVLIVAKNNNIKRVVFASSSAVYGNPDVFPITENTLLNPISPYGLHKMIGEKYLKLFSELYDLETVSLRYFNVYGPYFDLEGAYALVIGKFIKQLKDGQSMTVCGDGEYYRDYIHVDDIVQANILAMQSEKVGKGEFFNVGSGNFISVNELVKIINGPFEFIPERLGEARKTQADITKIKEVLNWNPKISLNKGIQKLKSDWGIV